MFSFEKGFEKRSHGQMDNAADWHDILLSSITSAEELERYFPVNKKEIEKVITDYPMKINPYYLALIRKQGDAMWKQVVPDVREIEDLTGTSDPLSEEDQSPVPNLVWRYPDRALFLVSDQCAIYCRFCLRKRNIGRSNGVTARSIQSGIQYIEQHRNIREVILSGGDPLLLEDEILEYILKRLRAISHLDLLRIHTRIPCSLPQRVTNKLSMMLKRFHPIYINTHFNHPEEITSEASKACIRLAEAGIPLGCQTVLLNGVNDSSGVMKSLMRKLLQIRVRPYYLHHLDRICGNAHFRTTIRDGLTIMRSLRGHLSGTGVPQYVIDLPGGYGKIPLTDEHFSRKDVCGMKFQSYTGKIIDYSELA